MKKSKLMKALLVFGMSAVTATAIVGFTACDEEHTHVDADNNGKCDVCGDTMPGSSGELTVAVEKVELNKDELTLDIDGEETLVATVTPDNADDKTVSWTSSDPSVATVNENGKVTALAAGETTITATAGGKSAECLVTVNTPEPKPVVTKEEWEAALSESAFTNFTATVKMSDAGEDETGDIIKVDLANGKYNENDDYYSKEADGKYYKYSKAEDSEKYVKEEITQEDYDGGCSELYPMYAIHFKDIFENENVGYDSEKESYVGTNIDIGDGNTYGIDIKFDNGKLIYADIDYGEEAHIIIQYSKYGSTTIDLPKVDGGETPNPGDEVSVIGTYYTYWLDKDIWAFDGENIVVKDNGTCLVAGKDATYEIDENGVISVNDGETYAKIDDKIMWLFENAADVDDCTKAIGFAYEGSEISAEDKTKIETTSGIKFNKVPNITEWTSVGDPIYGEVSDPDGDKCYHHILLVGDAAKDYYFDSYEVTVKLDGNEGVILESRQFSADNISTHTYDIHVRIKGNRYQTAVFSITFKKDGEVVATGTYTRVGDKTIILDKTTLNLNLTDETTGTLTATLKNLEGTVQWSSSDETVATVDENGTVTAVAEGTATITAKVGDISATCTVNVGEVEVPIVSVARIHAVYGGGVHCGVVLDGSDAAASKYAQVKENFAYVKVNGTKYNDMKDMFAFGADGSYRVNVYMGGAVEDDKDYVFEICDADGNVLMKTVALQKTDATIIDP